MQMSTFVSIQTTPNGRFMAVKAYDDGLLVSVFTLDDTATRTVAGAYRQAVVNAYIKHYGQADWPGVVCSSTIDDWEADRNVSLTSGMTQDEFADSCRAEASRICQAAGTLRQN